jgi:hypothetical protein
MAASWLTGPAAVPHRRPVVADKLLNIGSTKVKRFRGAAAKSEQGVPWKNRRYLIIRVSKVIFEA